MENRRAFTVRLAPRRLRGVTPGPGPEAVADEPGSTPASVPAAVAAGSIRRSTFHSRRRNRHGRGLRGDLLHPGLPGHRSRAERFAGLVLESADRLYDLWGDRIDGVQFGVEDIPAGLEALRAARTAIPLGSYRPATAAEPAAIIIYRHPVEEAAAGAAEVPDLIHDVVIEQAADLLGMLPEAVDPGYRGFRR